MSDPLSWSFPLGRIFGINVRVHVLFPVVAVGLLLQAAFKKNAAPGVWIDVAWLEGILFFSVLFHEFGHCFAGRYMDGEATDILMWPLGGLAYVDVPHTPRANLVTAVGGPAVNVLLCVLSGLALVFLLDPGWQPPWNLFDAPVRGSEAGTILVKLNGDVMLAPPLVLLIARIFWVNLFLAALNLLLIGFPLDGGRIFQALLWPYFGYRRATLAAVFAGYIFVVIVFIWGIAADEVLPLCLSLFIYFSCKHQWLVLETGGEESLLGYDFSQGYTSLERDEPPAEPKTKLNWWQRWQERRAARRLQRDQEQRETEESRMDELLQKVQTSGLNSLTDEERRFLKRVSDRYRNRN